MPASNIQKINLLLQQLKHGIQQEDLKDLIVFGSAAVTLHGIDLKRKIDDLDLFATEALYSKLKNKCSLTEFQKTKDLTYL